MAVEYFEPWLKEWHLEKWVSWAVKEFKQRLKQMTFSERVSWVVEYFKQWLKEMAFSNRVSWAVKDFKHWLRVSWTVEDFKQWLKEMQFSESWAVKDFKQWLRTSVYETVPNWAKFKNYGLLQWQKICMIFGDTYASGDGGTRSCNALSTNESNDMEDNNESCGDSNVAERVEPLGDSQLKANPTASPIHNHDRTPNTKRKKENSDSPLESKAIKTSPDQGWREMMN
ncbi:uncharacterized protein LOC122091112 isoform X1 [Macadamia integrifolia]|uniref:uncharacterized protein LOC122091112 isoform X1 n=2 Tax=Macadamia integrifolia TaxID=60698 RepID=UPI001C4FA15F|nr:uncharacterized protein LOC122091112 isoform X1 [Macadamia integrifolia]XP_042516873.1 uncharacterized protein LOC122091112 isoform X1 [Macadamia integrifolia]XP_042516874.1 uncharacterized protein LOC122091112 isoform X1 [Macadamia integrifolia]XP_042516875.1 uncharacterized protein LOC122091112 isoform X1 [Macadamia integrifolia]